MDGPEGHAAEGLELLDVGVAIFDKETRLVFANPAFRALRRYPDEICRAGVTLEALLRFNAERGDFGPGDAGAQVAERLAEISEAEPREIEREMADGQILRIRYRRTGSGGLLVTFDDVTAERRAQAALALSEERHALVTRATSDGIYDWNVTDDLLYVSDTLMRLFEFDLDIKASRMWAERVHEDDYDAYVAAIGAHFKGETEALECEYRVRKGDGGYRWVHDRGVGVRDRDGRVTRLVGAVRDITEIKEARAELDRTEARLLSSLATISDGILLVDADNRVQLWNDRYIEIFSEAAGGADISEVIFKGRPFFEMIRDGYNLGMFKPHPDGVDAWVAARTQAWEQPASQWEMELANGNWLLLNERRMPDGGRVSVYTDITELKRREQEAQAARERFEEAIEAISSGFALFDAEDRLVIWNSRFQEYFSEVADVFTPGVPFPEILAASNERGMFPGAGDDPEGFLTALLEKRAKGGGQAREQHLASGVWLQITDHRTKDGGLVSIYTDVTELKAREAEIRKQSAILELTLENMGQGISMVDRDLNTVAFNKKFIEMFEYPEEQFGRGFSMADAFRYNAERGEYGPGDVEEQVRERLELSRKFLAHRFERIRPDGTVIEIVGNPIEGGGFVSTYTDITERKRAEQASRDSEARLLGILENSPIGVAIIDDDNIIRFHNPRFPEILGGAGEDLVGTSSARFWTDRKEREESIAQFREEGRVRSREVRYRAMDGRDIWSLSSYEKAEWEGKPARLIWIYDITEEKANREALVVARDEAEAALADLQKAQQRLVQAEKMASLGQLTAGIAHEIKNPLNFVNNFAKLSDELLAELGDLLEAPIKALDEETRDDAEDLFRTVRDNLAKINQHGKRADSIVKNMLLHSREGPSERQVVNLNAIAEEALGLAYHGARAEHPDFNIEMEKSLDPELGEVECFPQDLMRVFLNLISNAMYAANKRAKEPGIEAGDGFSPTISLTTRAEGDRIEIVVRDNGAGIPPEVRDKIFVPFFTTKPAGEGTGLGLSLSYDIVVKQHGGELTVDSEPGKFTAFRVTLPRALPVDEGQH